MTTLVPSTLYTCEFLAHCRGMDLRAPDASPYDAVLTAVASAVRVVVAEEAKSNELRVAYVRVFGFGSVAIADLVFGVLGLRPLDQLWQSFALWMIGCVVFVAIRRNRFQAWYWLVLPLLDTIMLTTLMRARLVRLDGDPAVIGSAALLCALLAMSGALRFRRDAAVISTLLASLMLIVLMVPFTRAYVLVYALTSLVAVGFLAAWLAERVRLSMVGAASRTVLGRFLPADLVARSFEDPSGAISAPRSVDATALVSDLRGFTALAEKETPDRVFLFLSELQGALARVVAAHGGTVDKFLGDGMLAVFTDSPRPIGVDGTHAERALAAARDIRGVIAALNERSLLGAPLRLGIGVQSGTIVTGCLGTDARLESTVIGDAVNTASRLESLTKELDVDVLLTDGVLSRAPSALGRVMPMGTRRVRGREAPLVLFTLSA